MSAAAATPQQAALLAAAAAAAVNATGMQHRTLHLDQLPARRIPGGSFWRESESAAAAFEDEMRYALQKMFTCARKKEVSGATTPTGPGASPRGPGGQTPGGEAAEAASPMVVTCLPQKRAFMVEVIMKRVALQPEVLARHIDELDTTVLQAEEIAAVAQMLPTREEVEEVRRARLKAEAAAVTASRSSTPGRPATPGQAAGGAGTSPGGAANLQSPRLGPVEALFDALGRVPRLEQKMRVLSFRCEVVAANAAVREYTEALRGALAAVSRSGRLRALLLAVRDVANIMNAHRAGGKVQGFRLASLRRLRDTRMFDATHISVLHYLVAHMEANLPGALDLEDEEAAIKGAAKRGSLDTMAARVRGVREMQARLQADLERAASAAAAAGSGSDDEPKTPTAAQQAAPDPGDAAATARFAARLEELLQSTGPEVAAMQAALDDVTRRFRWTAEYFAEDVDGKHWEGQPLPFLRTLLEFMEALAAARRERPRIDRVVAILKEWEQAQLRARGGEEGEEGEGESDEEEDEGEEDEEEGWSDSGHGSEEDGRAASTPEPRGAGPAAAAAVPRLPLGALAEARTPASGAGGAAASAAAAAPPGPTPQQAFYTPATGHGTGAAGSPGLSPRGAGAAHPDCASPVAWFTPPQATPHDAPGSGGAGRQHGA